MTVYARCYISLLVMLVVVGIPALVVGAAIERDNWYGRLGMRCLIAFEILAAPGMLIAALYAIWL